MVSSNNDVEIANILTWIYNQNYMAMHAVSIGNTDQKYTKPHLEFLQGYSFDQGFLSPYFTTDKNKTKCEYGSIS